MLDIGAINEAVAAASQQAVIDFNKLILVIYGDKGVGKSTYISRVPKPFVIDFEDRLRTVLDAEGKSIPSHTCYKWGEAVQLVNALANTTPAETGIETVCVDGIGTGFKYLRNSILKKYKVSHENEGELAYGKGKGLIKDALEDWFTALRKLTRQGYGVVLTAHERSVEFTNNGVAFDRKVPLVSGDKSEYGWDAIKPFPDIVVHAYKTRGANGPEHRMHLVGTELYEAMFSKPGADVSKIADLPFSYASLEAAWND
jgi:hypothetical protein